MRMLYWPARSPLNSSNRLFGGIRKSSILPAQSSCSSFRRATRSIFAKRGTRLRPNKNSVSGQENDKIIEIVTPRVNNVKRYQLLFVIYYRVKLSQIRRICDNFIYLRTHLVINNQRSMVAKPR